MTHSSRPLLKLRGTLITAVVLVGVIIGLWQIDLVRQNAQILWLTMTGKAWKLRGHIRTVLVWSRAMREDRRVFVYTPSGYSAKSESAHRYPVIYLLHGFPGGPTDWLRYGRAPEVLERLNVAGSIPPSIMVIPDGNGVGMLGDSEFIDAPGKEAGTPGAAAGTFIWRDLVRWVDSHYRTDPGPANRLLVGVSSGGYGAVNLALQHPDIFGAAFSFSGYFKADQHGWARPVWGRHPTTDELYEQSPTEYVDSPQARWSSMYVYIGDGEGEHPPYPQQAASFATRLQTAGIAYNHVMMPGKHSWDLWRDLLRDALLKYAQHQNGRQWART